MMLALYVRAAWTEPITRTTAISANRNIPRADTLLLSPARASAMAIVIEVDGGGKKEGRRSVCGWNGWSGVVLTAEHPPHHTTATAESVFDKSGRRTKGEGPRAKTESHSLMPDMGLLSFSYDYRGTARAPLSVTFSVKMQR
jgi:hypothetical protein